MKITQITQNHNNTSMKQTTKNQQTFMGKSIGKLPVNLDPQKRIALRVILDEFAQSLGERINLHIFNVKSTGNSSKRILFAVEKHNRQSLSSALMKNRRIKSTDENLGLLILDTNNTGLGRYKNPQGFEIDFSAPITKIKAALETFKKSLAKKSSKKA